VPISNPAEVTKVRSKVPLQLKFSLLNVYQLTWVIQSHYPINIGLVDISILTFYLRLFPGECIRRLVYIMLMISALIAITNFLTVFLQCLPLHRIWALPGTVGYLEGHCIKKPYVVVTFACISVFVYACILLLPLKPLASKSSI
jgi:hypothetical protein